MQDLGIDRRSILKGSQVIGCYDVDWTCLAVVRDHCQAVINTLMKLQVTRDKFIN